MKFKSLTNCFQFTVLNPYNEGGWSTNEQYKLALNDELILKLALVHDLVEVYAGDTDGHGDKDKIAAKEKKEMRAFEMLKKEYGQFEQMLVAIEKYEKREVPEAQLVYLMDKVIPDINIHSSKSDYYRSRKVNFDGWKKWLLNKISITPLSPKLKPLMDEIISEIEDRSQDIFYKGG